MSTVEFIQGECSRCGVIIHGPLDDTLPATLHWIIPGRGPFKGNVYKAELICKNQAQCVERQQHGIG